MQLDENVNCAPKPKGAVVGKNSLWQMGRNLRRNSRGYPPMVPFRVPLRWAFLGGTLQRALCAAALHGRLQLFRERGPVGTLEGHFPPPGLDGGAAEPPLACPGALHPRHLAGGGAGLMALMALQLLSDQLSLAGRFC